MFPRFQQINLEVNIVSNIIQIVFFDIYSFILFAVTNQKSSVVYAQTTTNGQVIIHDGEFPDCHQTSNINRTLVGNKNVDHSDVVGASPVGAAPTTS